MTDVKLYLGDWREIITQHLLETKIDAIIADPPYDGQFSIDYWKDRVYGNVLTFCKPENQYFTPDEYLFWIKTPSTKNFISKVGRFVEMILVKRQGSTFNRLHWSQMTGVYDDRLIYPPSHPYEKPLSLMERLIRIYTNPGDVVIDPFMGVGTTGVACVNLGRKFIGIEIDPVYYDLAAFNIERPE
jgi:DNA modification methylase